jgi:hypothetical protein
MFIKRKIYKKISNKTEKYFRYVELFLDSYDFEVKKSRNFSPCRSPVLRNFRLSLFCDVTQLLLVVIDVSGQPA